MGGFERALIDAVETWAAHHRLSTRAPIETATALAIALYREGATLGEARQRAEGFLRSWVSHPCNTPAGPPPRLRAVS